MVVPTHPNVVVVDIMANTRYGDEAYDQLGLKPHLTFWGERSPDGVEKDAMLPGELLGNIENVILTGIDRGAVTFKGVIYPFEVTKRD